MENPLSEHEMTNGTFKQLQLIQPEPSNLNYYDKVGFQVKTCGVRKYNLLREALKETIGLLFFIITVYFCLQTSSVQSPRVSLQRLWFHREPLRCDRDQRSRGD